MNSTPNGPDLHGPRTMDVSVVIPTLNEGRHIAGLVERTRRLGPREIIVVDGGSSDDTREQASTADRVLLTGPGRAIQQNAGAAGASGDVVLFLHADCWLEESAIDGIRDAFHDSNVGGGCFRQRIDAPGAVYRSIEWGNNQRVRLLRWAYGDQGIFVKRSVFTELGGFPEVSLMEDLLLMKQLKRHAKFVLLPNRIHTSARRWQTQGVVRQTIRNWSFLFLSHCGVSPDRLARHYPQIR